MTQELTDFKRKIETFIWENSMNINVYEMRELLYEIARDLNEGAAKSTTVPSVMAYMNMQKARKRVRPL